MTLPFFVEEADHRGMPANLTPQYHDAEMRLRRATSQLPNPAKVRQTRRDLARVKTLLGERARGAKGAGA